AARTHAPHGLEHLGADRGHRVSCSRTSHRPLAPLAWIGGHRGAVRARLSPDLLGNVSAGTIHRRAGPVTRRGRLRRRADRGRIHRAGNKDSKRSPSTRSVARRGVLTTRREFVHEPAIRPGRLWPYVAAYLLLLGLVATMVVRWSARADWGAAHRLTL